MMKICGAFGKSKNAKKISDALICLKCAKICVKMHILFGKETLEFIINPGYAQNKDIAQPIFPSPAHFYSVFILISK